MIDSKKTNEKQMLSSFLQISLGVTFFAIILTTYAVVELVKAHYQKSAETTLMTVLSTMTEAVRLWEEEQSLTAQQLAEEPHIIAATQSLLALPHTSAALLGAAAQQQLRDELHLQLKYYRDYFIIAPDNTILAASQDSHVGTPSVLRQSPEVLAPLWRGETLLTPLPSSEHKASPEAHPQFDNETLFVVGTPIKAQNGQIIALLGLRIDLYKILFRLAAKTRLGQTGESYLFNKQSLIFGDGNFQAASFTRAASAMNGKLGVDVHGYRNHRGIWVVGAWQWDAQLQLGIVTEQEVSEAYTVFYFVRHLMYGSGALAMLALLALMWVFTLGERRLRRLRHKLQAIVETANDGIAVIDEHGCIECVNPAMEKLFGYSVAQMLGNNINMLMPEPYRSQHDGYIQRYLQTGESKIIGQIRELQGKHQDGREFPVELSVNPLEIDDKPHFAGIIHDISARKQAEQDLQAERDFTHAVLDSLAEHLAVLDERGQITLTNKVWRDFYKNNGLLAVEQVDVGSNYLQVTQRAAEAGVEEAVPIYQQLQSMLAHQLTHFSTDYACHSPQQQRWFEMQAQHFKHKGRSAIVVSHLEVTQRKISEMQLQALNEQLRIISLVAESTRHAVIVTDAQDRIQWVNRGFTQLSGYSLEEVQGRKPGAFLQGEATDKSVAERIGKTIRQGERIEGEILNYHKNGTPYWIYFEISPVYDEQRNLLQFVALEQDVTEQKHTKQALEQAKIEAENANRAKSIFLATMSHEIRTPLNGVVGTIDILAHTHLDNKQRDLIVTAQDSANSLQSIIDDILDFSKIEAGKLELELMPLDLESLAESLSESLHPIAQKHHVDLLLYCDPQLPKVKGDAVRIRQILYNLVGNAIKFSSQQTERQGLVILSVTLEYQAERRVQICLRVTDNGIGMNEDLQSRLFQAFEQGESTTTRRFGGTGLGLAITQRLVKLMDGYIEVQSQLKQGSIFSVYLVLQQVIESTPKKLSDLRALKILLISQGMPSKILQSYLQHAGATVITSSLDNAIENCRRYCQDAPQQAVVVIDTDSEHSLCTALLDQLRHEFAPIHLRFVLVERGRRRSARVYESDAMTLDFNAMRRATLLNAVAAVTGRESPQQDSSLQTLPLSPLAPSREVAQQQGRLILLADDNEINRKVIGQQLNMLGYWADFAEDGEQALHRWKSEDYALLMTDCHMPNMDGYQLAATIRQDEIPTRHRPIVAITADALKSTTRKCLAVGMDACLTKPIQLQQLQNFLEKWLPNTAQATMPSEVTTAETAPPSINVAPAAIDAAALAYILGSEEKPKLAHYYQQFLLISYPIVEQLQAALQKEDRSTIRHLAHQLKSSARMIGAYQLADYCEVLEHTDRNAENASANQPAEHFLELFQDAKVWIEDYCKHL